MSSKHTHNKMSGDAQSVSFDKKGRDNYDF